MEEKYQKVDNSKNANPLNSFLEKFKKILNKSQFQKDLIIEVLNKEFNRGFKKDDIKIQKGIVYINESPLVKNEILIRKQKLITNIKSQSGNILDIK